MRIIFFIGMLCLSFASVAHAEIPSFDTVHQDLIQEMEAADQQALPFNKRVKTISHFVKKLRRLHDYELGHPKLSVVYHKDEILKRKTAFKQQLVSLWTSYQQEVKPILLRNIKFERNDNAAQQNKGALVQLSFPSKYNYRTGKPIIGLLNNQQDESDSMFQKHMVEAGLLVNFPEWEKETWLNQAIRMDVELAVFRALHRRYQDDMALPWTIKKNVEQSSVMVANNVEKPSENIQIRGEHVFLEKERIEKVRDFTRELRKFDVSQDISALKRDLQQMLEVYEQHIKPILVTNVNQNIRDAAAGANKGDLIFLFFPHHSNHQTGKPITGKLRYTKDVSTSFFQTEMKEVGLLVEQPELEQDKVIQRALLMESELETLKEEHQRYLGEDSITLIHQ